VRRRSSGSGGAERGVVDPRVHDGVVDDILFGRPVDALCGLRPSLREQPLVALVEAIGGVSLPFAWRQPELGREFVVDCLVVNVRQVSSSRFRWKSRSRMRVSAAAGGISRLTLFESDDIGSRLRRGVV